jgi:hypothetical protein
VAGRVAGTPKPPGELGRCQGVRQLEERARIALRLGDDAIANLHVEGAGNDRREERVRLGLRETLDDKFGQAGQLFAGFTHGEYQRDPLGAPSARHEREHLRRRPVE